MSLVLQVVVVTKNRPYLDKDTGQCFAYIRKPTHADAFEEVKCYYTMLIRM